MVRTLLASSACNSSRPISYCPGSICSISDRILVLNKGKLHLSGTPQEVFADTGKLHEIGLDVPTYTRILRALRDKGFDLADAYTLPDAAKLLCGLRKEGVRT